MKKYNKEADNFCNEICKILKDLQLIRKKIESFSENGLFGFDELDNINSALVDVWLEVESITKYVEKKKEPLFYSILELK